MLLEPGGAVRSGRSINWLGDGTWAVGDGDGGALQKMSAVIHWEMEKWKHAT